jgi:hypothetical protein
MIEEYYLLGYNAVQSVESQPSRACLPPDITLVSCSAYSSNLKMEAICSSETSVDFQRTTEDSTLHNHRCENLKSYKIIIDEGEIITNHFIIIE